MLKDVDKNHPHIQISLSPRDIEILQGILTERKRINYSVRILELTSEEHVAEEDRVIGLIFDQISQGRMNL